MDRVVILWERPDVLSNAEAVSWARAEVQRLLVSDDVAGVCLRPVAPVEDGEPRRYDWMLEVDLATASSWHDSPLRELVGDLRMLGMRPLVVVPGDITVQLSR